MASSAARDAWPPAAAHMAPECATLVSAMPKVFLCYRRADLEHAAGRSYDRLVHHLGRANVFRDRSTLQSGANFSAKIARAIDQANWFLVLIGDNWLTERLAEADDFVRREIEQALSRPTLTIVPLLCGKAQMPQAEALPESIRVLAEKQAFRLHDESFDRDIDALAAEIGPSSQVWRLRTAIAVALGAAATLLSAIIESSRHPTVASPAPQGQRPVTNQAPPSRHMEGPVEVKSFGDNSPNVVGNSGTIIIGGSSNEETPSGSAKPEHGQATR